jgi:phosphoribosylamine--glycine ligase
VKVLVIGSGGREHALCWKLAQDRKIDEVFVAPGNPGIALEPKVTCVAITDFEALATFCRDRRVELVVVGPDQALADGAVDFFEGEGIPTFGPSRAAARIESSKAFAKELMKNAGIPTARFDVFSDLARAQEFLRNVSWGDGWVIKADGLALGKGVVVCASREEALATAEDFLSGDSMGEAGRRIVVEERLSGRELSAFYLCDGKRAVSFRHACDYKRIHDGDQGLNTGGMGAFAPPDWLPAGFEARVEKEIVEPLLRAHSFRGMLFVGLMATAQGPKVIEFNARFGDPETQALLPLLGEDLLPWLRAARDGRLEEMPASGPLWKELSAVHVVLAAEGYPG